MKRTINFLIMTLISASLLGFCYWIKPTLSTEEFKAEMEWVKGGINED